MAPRGERGGSAREGGPRGARDLAGVPITVVGAGVVGLTCALRLAEAGAAVRVLARDRLDGTTSGVAAAVWYPYRAFPYDRVLGWARTGYDEFVHLARAGADSDVVSAGVRLRPGTELRPDDGPDPWWAGAVPDLVKVTDVPPGYRIGWRFAAPVVDMSRYLPWLERRLATHGVVPETATVRDLDDAGAHGAEVVVNCAGLGARELAPDPTVSPVRGQVVVVDGIRVDEWVVDDGDGRALTYVVPRIDDVVVGGTADEGADDMTADPATAAAILARATTLVPALADARVIAHKVGLRPARPTVRLEAERRTGVPVVHCYGHGGAGVTLSWGCAADVATLAAEVR